MQANIYPDIITKEFLDSNPNIMFVFGDNLQRVGRGGAAILRDHPQSYGFITKKAPTHNLCDYYTPSEYKATFALECYKLAELAKQNPDKIWLISKVGAGLANQFGIFEKIIEPEIKNKFRDISNIVFLW